MFDLLFGPFGTFHSRKETFFCEVLVMKSEGCSGRYRHYFWIPGSFESTCVPRTQNFEIWN
jgi:hypothetical protein